jgi:hypothetical protein
MTTPSQQSSLLVSLSELHDRFARILPALESYIPFACRGVRCPAQRDDRAAEMRAIAWTWLCRLAEQGRDASAFAPSLAFMVARHVRCGRRLAGAERSRDVLSRLAQHKHGFAVGRLPDFSTLMGNPFDEAVQDNTRSPVPDQVQFRCDFPAWLRQWDHRNREIVRCMALGERTQDLARSFHLSPARVSQLRRQYHDSWELFCSELPAHARLAMPQLE